MSWPLFWTIVLQVFIALVACLPFSILVRLALDIAIPSRKIPSKTTLIFKGENLDH